MVVSVKWWAFWWVFSHPDREKESILGIYEIRDSGGIGVVAWDFLMRGVSSSRTWPTYGSFHPGPFFGRPFDNNPNCLGPYWAADFGNSRIPEGLHAFN